MNRPESHDQDMHALIREQIDYYEAHASEYDDAFRRVGRWDRGLVLNRRWLAEWRLVRCKVESLARKRAGGTALDLACGTGYWTELLAISGLAVHAVDAAPSMIAIAQNRLKKYGVDFEICDLFEFAPRGRYDMVMSGFWLSHVPRQICAGFIQKLSRWTAGEGGRVIVVDHLPSVESFTMDCASSDFPRGIAYRTVADGRRFCIPKVFRSEKEMRTVFSAAGFEYQSVFNGKWVFVGVALSKES